MDAIAQAHVFFRQKAEAQLDPPVPDAVTVSLAQSDTDEEIAVELLPGGAMVAEGQYFIIEYRDSAGRPSTRRISVYGIKAGTSGIPILVAKCHERQAQRSFRVDRIQNVIDFDGVVIEPLSEFYKNTFGLLWPKPGFVPETFDASPGRMTLARRFCRERGIVLLAALSHADHEMCEAEVGEIVDYCSAVCVENELDLGEREMEMLTAYVRRLRPNVDAISRAVDQIVALESGAMMRFLQTGVRVIEADGFLHHREVKMLDEFSQALTGLSILPR